MPKVIQCIYCKKAFMTSTYGMINHVTKKCNEFKEFEKKKKVDKKKKYTIVHIHSI